MPGKLVSRMFEHDPTLNAPPRHRRACRYESFVPVELGSLEVMLDGPMIALLSEAETAIRELNAQGGAALMPLASLLLRTESIASSRIEGLQLGARDLARAEAKKESGIAVGSTAVEVLANIDAMELAVERAATAEQFGEVQLLDVHRRLLEGGTQRDIAGKLRTTQNWIGGNDYNPCGAAFVPPPPEEVERLLNDLYAVINDDMHSPLLQAALAHAQFETIHPFADGNGRTGRALVHAILRRRGLAPRFVPPISIIFAGARDRYIAGLTSFRGDDITGWIEQFAVATKAAADLARRYLGVVSALQDEWRETLRSSPVAPRADSAAWAIIDLLPGHPMISAPVATALTGRARSSTFESIDRLVTAGILLPLTTGRRNRWWEAAGLLDIIERLDAGLPPHAPPPATPGPSRA